MEPVWKKCYFILVLSVAASCCAFAQGIDEHKIAPEVLRAMKEAPEAYHPVILMLDDRVDIRALEDDLLLRKASLEERAFEVITTLQAKAEATQPLLLGRLEHLDGIKEGSIHPFWITNAIFAEATPAAIARLSQEKTVGLILDNHEIEVLDNGMSPSVAPVLSNSAERGLLAIGAQQMWAMGYTGYGRKAMIVDTGEDAAHPAIYNQFAYHRQEFSASWASPGATQYCDSHGTHVTGTIVGLDRLNADTIGVAFEGQWLGGPVRLGGCEYPGTVLNIFQTFQWALDPDGNPATIEDMPDAINNSWGGPSPNSGDCGAPNDVEIYDALMAAGIAVIFAAGNEGPGASTIRSPAMNNYDLARIFSVGNVNANNSSFPINGGSSRGPSICGGTGSLLIKPEVSAPGTSIRSCVAGGGYASWDGTSMAAPHVTGAVLLLKEAFPYLPGEELMLALYFSCTDLGVAGEDNSYGMGIINVPAAYRYLIEQGHEPVPPVEAANDVILLRADTRNLNCEGQAVTRLLVENNSTQAITSLDIRQALLSGEEPTFFTYHWEGLIEPGERKYVQMPPLDSEPGDFEYVAEIFQANGEADARRLNNQLKTNVRIIADEFLEGRVSGNRTVCQGGQALLQSLYEGPATVRWYDGLLDGNLLAEGNNALLPVGDEPATVYMEVSPLQKVGRVDNEAGILQFSSEAQGLAFDAYTAFTIKSVKVYAEESGSRLLVLRGPSGFSITRIAPVQAGESRISLDLDIEPGEGYTLEFRAGKPLGLNLGGSDLPYILPNVLSINRSTQSPAHYHYFYDWEVEFPYFCGRTPVAVEVLPTENPLQAAYSPMDAEIDLSSGINEVSFTDDTEGAISWLWDFGDGTTGTQPNPTHVYSDTGQYQVTLTVIGQDGCASSTTGRVAVTETDVTAVGHLDREYGMEIFPNPTNGILYLSLDMAGPREVEVFLSDMLGRPVWRQRLALSPNEATELPVSGLPGGLYAVVVRLDGGQIERRVVVQR
ncbi:MAG: S8 family serine peptidase [Lewinellaceae bacterium]|nr:S8 family serine peptidase [Lewinellaceae bacterium]